MTIHLLDSNTITFLTQGNEAAWQHWADLSKEDEVLTCFAVIAEWEYGILNAKRREKQQEIRAQGELVLNRMSRIIETTPEIDLAYGQIASELRRAGTMIPQNDMLIAAVARILDATVVANDKHFRHVQNLTVVDWTKP